MSQPPANEPGKFLDGKLPPNVRLGTNTILKGEHAFTRFHSQLKDALVIGDHCTMDGAQFSLHDTARVTIGNYCYFTNCMLMCELELRIESYVVIGWNAAIADSDFHPIAPAERIADTIACLPIGQGRPRPPVPKLPVIIEDGVWIGPNATILKGVRIGEGAFVEPGAMITRDVPPRGRMLGNPARQIGTV